MYYSYPCPACGKVFYTFNDYREYAAKILYHGIKQHMADYKEDEKEHEMDERPDIEEEQMYHIAKESEEAPSSAYELR